MDDDALVRLFSQASASGWSLQSSIQLQDWLENFTKWTNVRADHVATQVNNLVDQTSKVEMDLRNTYNNFRLLSNSQFVENRVHDEDETAAIGLELTRHAESKEVPFQSYESDIVPRYKEAVFTAWKAYDQLGRRVSKSSSLGDFQRDRYRQRLPYIIGSEDFERDNCCGLREYSVSEASTYDNDFEKRQTTLEARPILTSVTNEREFSTTGSDTSDVEHMQKQGEPVVSAALDFKAMLEAALRGPYITYDRFASSFTQENTGDHGSYSAGELGNVPGIRSGEDYSTADTISFSSTKIADDFPGGSSPKDGGTAHCKGDTSITLQNSSNSSFEDKSRISMLATVKKSVPAIATEQNNEGALAGAQSSPFPISRLRIPREKKQEKGSFLTQDRSTPNLDSYSPSAPDNRIKGAKEDIISGTVRHEDDSAVEAFDLNLFRKFETLSSNKTNVEGGLFDDDFEEVNDELYGKMDLSSSQKLDTKERHKGFVQEKSIQREEPVDKPPLNDILSQISSEDAFPLANNSALSTISNVPGSSSGLQDLGRTNSMLDIKKSMSAKFGQNIVPESTWDSCVESEQISEQAQNTLEKMDRKTAQVLAAKKSGISGSTNDNDDSDDCSSSCSTNNQGENEACQIKPVGLEAVTSVEGKEFMTLKQDTFAVNPSPVSTNSKFPAESRGKTILSEETLPSQARLLQSTTAKHVSATSSPQHFSSTYSTMDESIRDHDGADISTSQPREKAHESSISEAGSSYPVTGSKIENEIVGVHSKSRAEPVVVETLKSSLFGFPPEKISLYGQKSNMLAGPKETKSSLSAILFADDDEDQEDSLFGPLQVKSSRKTYNSGHFTGNTETSDMAAIGSSIVKPVGVSGTGESDTKHSTQDLEKSSAIGSDISTGVHERERVRSLFHD